MGMLAEIVRRLLEMPAAKLRRVAERLSEENEAADTHNSGPEDESPDSDES